MRTILLALTICGCGGAGAQGDVETADAPRTAAPTAPRAPEVLAEVSTRGEVDGNLVCVVPAGPDALAFGVWATLGAFRRMPVAAGAIEPFPGFPPDGKVEGAMGIFGCPMASPDGASLAYALLPADAEAVVHVRAPDGSGDRALGNGLPIGWSTAGADVVAVEATFSSPATRIVAIPLAGGDARTVHSVPAGRMLFFQGAVSPDGTQVAFTSAPVGRVAASDVWIVPSAGGEARALTSDGLENASPAFTSDGRGVLFTSRRGGDVDLWVVPSSGGEPSPIVTAPGIESSPGANGGAIVFGWRDAAPSVVTVRSPTDATPRTLPGTADDVFDVRISPDGATVAFARGLPTETNLYVQSIAGGTARAIATLPGADSRPAFSPDNNSIAYVSTREGPGDVYLLPLAGGAARRLTQNSGIAPAARLLFSPDGQKLAYVRLVDGVPKLTILPLGGGAQVDLVERPTSYAFEPDGRTLLVTVVAGPRTEVRRIKVDGSGRPETLRWAFPWTRLLSVSGPRGRTKALLFEDTDQRRLIRVDVARGEREVLAQLPLNMDFARFSIDASADGAVLVTTEALLSTEIRQVANGADVVRARLP